MHGSALLSAAFYRVSSLSSLVVAGGQQQQQPAAAGSHTGDEEEEGEAMKGGRRPEVDLDLFLERVRSSSTGRRGKENHGPWRERRRRSRSASPSPASSSSSSSVVAAAAGMDRRGSRQSWRGRETKCSTAKQPPRQNVCGGGGGGRRVAPAADRSWCAKSRTQSEGEEGAAASTRGTCVWPRLRRGLLEKAEQVVATGVQLRASSLVSGGGRVG